MSKLSSIYRTHNCGELKKDTVGEKVILSGWVHRKRDHGGVLFIDLRDHYGITQLVTSDKEANLLKITEQQYQVLNNITHESVITIHGIVVKRSEEAVNKDLQTGEIEVVITDLSVLSNAEYLPIIINNDQQFPEDLRLEYRFLDLRREKLHKNIMLRNDVIRHLREEMHKLGFYEFQTPILQPHLHSTCCCLNLNL